MSTKDTNSTFDAIRLPTSMLESIVLNIQYGCWPFGTKKSQHVYLVPKNESAIGADNPLTREYLVEKDK